MSNGKKIVLVVIVFLILVVAFTTNGLYQYEAKENGLLRQRLAEQQSLSAQKTDTNTALSQTGAADRYVSGYEFECGTSTDLYRDYSDGSKELVAAHIEKSSANLAPGDCFEVETSDQGRNYALSKKLYLVQWAQGDAGAFGYYEFDIQQKVFSKSKFVYPFVLAPKVMDSEKHTQITLGSPDSDDEVRSLSIIDFYDGTTGTFAYLPKGYSYVQSKSSDELFGGTDYNMDVQWIDNQFVASVFSVKDPIVACGYLNPGPCKMRVPVFKVGIDVYNWEAQQVVKP